MLHQHLAAVYDEEFQVYAYFFSHEKNEDRFE